MTDEQNERLKQIREWQSHDTRLRHHKDAEHIDFLLSLLDSQEPQRLLEEILKTLDDAVIRVGCSANCYDVPADANSGAEYVAMRVRQVIGVDGKARPAVVPGANVERFYFFDSHGDMAFVREADYEQATTTMRSRCVEKVREMYDEWDHDGRLLRTMSLTVKAEAAKQIISALESLPLEQGEQEKQ